VKFISKLILVIVVLAYPVFVTGQKEYQNGYIVTNSNDTLYGKIRDRREPPFGTIYKKIRLRNNNLFPKKYGPKKIRAYRVGENYFETKWLDTKSLFLRQFYSSREGIGERCFLKVIIKDYLTFYQWEFVDPESGYFDEISFFKRKNDPALFRVNQTIFGVNRKRMAEYFMDYPELAMKIKNREMKDLVSIANFYNNWKTSTE
jgi:hypothetical protein